MLSEVDANLKWHQSKKRSKSCSFCLILINLKKKKQVILMLNLPSPRPIFFEMIQVGLNFQSIDFVVLNLYKGIPLFLHNQVCNPDKECDCHYYEDCKGHLF